MPKRNDYQLSDEQVQLIDDAIKHAPEPEVRQRAMAVKLLHVGHSAQEVAEMMAVELVSIYNWHKRWVAEGIAGLKNRPRSGRPTKADQSYRDLLAEVIEQDPLELDVRLLCPWDFPGKSTVMHCHFLPQGIFPTQELSPSILDWQMDSSPL